jgi:hypothetical protein
MPCARPRGPRAWGLADWQVPEYRTGVGSLDRLDRHVRVRRVRSGWRRRRYARAGHACAPAGWPPARRAASLTRDGSGGCRCRLPAGRHLGPVAECGCGSACVAVGGGLRRMGRRVVVEVPYLHRWFAVDPVQDFGSRMCGRHRHTATLYYVSFDLCKREAQGGRWRANCC